MPPEPMKLPEPGPPDYPKWLEESWVVRDEWKTTGVYRLLPRTYRELEVLLWQSEQRWLAGDSEDAIKTEFDARFSDLKKQREQLALKVQQPQSIAEARRNVTDDKDSAVRKAVRPLLERLMAKPAKPEDPSPLKPDDLKPFLEKPPEAAPFAAVSYHTVAAALEIADPASNQPKWFDDFLRATCSPEPQFIELAALRFLASVEAGRNKKWDRDREREPQLGGMRRLLLAAAQAAERAAPADPRLWPWLQKRIADTDAEHRKGIVFLATGEEDDRRTGHAKLKGAVDSFDKIASDGAALQEAFRQVDEARITLPALVIPLSRRVPDDKDRQLWADAIDLTIELRKLLVAPADAREVPVDRMKSLAGKLRDTLGSLLAPYQRDEATQIIRRAGKENGPTADDLRQMLDAPQWPAATRKQIYNAARDLGQSTAAEAVARAGALKPRSPLPQDRANRADAPGWRARLAIDLLRLGGATNTAPLEELLTKANRSGEWQELGEAIRRAWAVDLPKKFRELTDAAARERAGDVLHPLDVSALPEGPGHGPVEPAADLRRRELATYWQDLARDRYQAAATELGKYPPERTDLGNYARAFDQVRRAFQERTP